MILSGISNMYWITRLSSIYDALLFVFIVAIIVASITGLVVLVFSYDDHDGTWVKNIKKYFVTAIAAIILSGIGLTFIPRTNEVLLIYGIGTTIDHVDSNDTIKRLPDKAIQALDKYLDSLNEGNENKKNIINESD